MRLATSRCALRTFRAQGILHAQSLADIGGTARRRTAQDAEIERWNRLHLQGLQRDVAKLPALLTSFTEASKRRESCETQMDDNLAQQAATQMALSECSERALAKRQMLERRVANLKTAYKRQENQLERLKSQELRAEKLHQRAIDSQQELARLHGQTAER